MLCRNCGAQIPDNSKFCTECGIKIETEPTGVVLKKEISDKHYSLEEISQQQSESKLITNNISSSDTEQSNIILTKEPYNYSQEVSSTAVFGSPQQSNPANPFDRYKNNAFNTSDNTNHQNTQQRISFEKTNNTFGGSMNQPQNQSNGFEEMPTTQNTFSGGMSQPQNQSNDFGEMPTTQNTFGGGMNQSQNQSNGFEEMPTTQNTFGGGMNQPQNQSNGFGEIPTTQNTFYGDMNQPQNQSNGFGEMPTTQNTFYGGMNQPQNQSNGFGEIPTTQNAFYGGMNQPQNQSNGFGEMPNNTFTPINTQTSANNISLQNSNSNNKVAKIMVIVAVVVVLALLAGIAFMLLSGYYNGNDESGNGGNIVAPINQGNVEFKDVIYSNQANYSLATEDDTGNVYYVTTDNFIIKKYASGTEEKIYDSWAMCLNYYNERLYFVSPVNGYNTVCSININGTDLKTHTKQKEVYTLSVADGYAYYVINNYGSSEDSSAVFRVNLDSGSVDNITVENKASVYAVFDYKDSIYVHCLYNSSYIGYLKKINKTNLKDVTEIQPQSTYNECDIYSVTIYNDKLYFINCKDNISDYSYTLCSMNMDGSEYQEIGGTDCSQLSVYGEYIYYVSGKNNSLNRIKTDGTDNVCLKASGVSNVSIADNKIHYLNKNEEIWTMNLDGSNNKLLK